jgi:hypothetical protein
LKAYPLLVPFSTVVTVEAGLDLGLNCEVEGGGKQLLKITWVRGGKEFSTDGILQARTFEGETLQFVNVTSQVDGFYKCCLNKEQQCSNEITVKVIDRPKVVAQWGKQQVCVNPGTRNFSLSVDVVFHGSGICQWEKDGQLIKLDNNCVIKGRRRLILQFDTIEKSDSGTYTVIIWTRFGATNKSVTLLVQGPPVAPPIPKTSFVEQTTVVVMIPVNSSTGHLIEYKLVGGMKWMMVNVSAGFVGKPVSITGLTSCSEYEIRLKAYNEDGTSPPSPSVNVKTPSLRFDQVHLYAFQEGILVLHQDHYIHGCFPLGSHMTMLGDYICNITGNMNVSDEPLNYSMINSTILQFLPACDKDEAATCLTICSSLVQVCPHGQMTLSRQEICPLKADPIQESHDNKSSTGKITVIVAVIVGIIAVISVITLALAVWRCKHHSRDYSLTENTDGIPMNSWPKSKDTEIVNSKVTDRDRDYAETGSSKGNSVKASTLSKMGGLPVVEDDLMDETEKYEVGCLGSQIHSGASPVDMTRVPDGTQLNTSVHIITDGNDEEEHQPEAASPLNTSIQTEDAVNSNGAELPTSHEMHSQIQGSTWNCRFEQSQSQLSSQSLSHPNSCPARSIGLNEELLRCDKPIQGEFQRCFSFLI